MMLYRETIRVPSDRIGVIVGRNGRVKKRVEELTNVVIEISPEGLVCITGKTDVDGPVNMWKARDIIRAMARGFSPKNAFALLDDDDASLVVYSLREIVGSTRSHLKRIAGRVIGENGRARRVIEDITGVKISVYGDTISIIGTYPRLQIASRAIEMIIEGAPHGVVYKYLERMRREIVRAEADIWE